MDILYGVLEEWWNTKEEIIFENAKYFINLNEILTLYQKNVHKSGMTANIYIFNSIFGADSAVLKALERANGRSHSCVLYKRHQIMISATERPHGGASTPALFAIPPSWAAYKRLNLIIH